MYGFFTVVTFALIMDLKANKKRGKKTDNMKTHYENMPVWNDALDVATQTYKITEQFPRRESYGLSSQMQRAAVSISANIAEGAGRGSRAELAHFAGISLGSVNELRTLYIIAKRVGYVDEETSRGIEEKLENIGRQLAAFRSYLKK